MPISDYDLELLKLQMLMQQGQPKRMPSFPGSVLHGATLGWAGTPPETVPDYIGSFLGGAIPAIGIGLLTEGVGVPAALARALSLGKAGHAAVRGGLVGGLMGGAFGKETSTPERIANALLGAVTGGAMDYGITRYKLGKLPQAPVQEKLPDLQPGFVDPAYAQMRKEAASVGATFPPGAGATFTFPERAGSILGEGQQQLQLPIKTAASVKAEAVPGSVEFSAKMTPQKTLSWLKDEAAAKGLYFDYTKKPDAKGFRIHMYDGLKPGASNLAFKSIDDAFDYIVSTRGPLVAGPSPFEVKNVLTGQISSFRSLDDAQKHLRNELFRNLKGEATQFKLFGNPIDEATMSSARTKGWTIYDQPDGISAIGMGGKVERFSNADELKKFMFLQPDLPHPPSVTLGTLDKIANRLPLSDMDEAAIAATRFLRYGPPVTIGHSVSEGLQKLGDRARVNVVKGVKTEADFDRVMKDIKARGYEAKVMDMGGERDIMYYQKWQQPEKDAARLWSLYRLKGSEALTLDDMRFMGIVFGKTPREVGEWALSNAAINAIEGNTRTLLLDQLRFPQFHKSPFISAISRLVHGSYLNVANDKDFITRDVAPIFAKLNPAERVAALHGIQGEIPLSELTENARDAALVARKWFADIAKRMGLKQWDNYATHITDFDAYWAAFHKDIAMNDYAHAPSALQKKLTEKEWIRLREIALKPKNVPQPGKEVWRFINSEDRGFIKERLFKWDDVAKSMDQLPDYVRRLVPTEMFNPYMIPRRKNVQVPYKEDLVEVFDTYVNRMLHDIHFRPLLEKPVINVPDRGPMSIPQLINSMPGSGVSGSERRYLERYIARVITGRPDSFASMLRNLTDNVNDTIGVSITDSNFLNDVITMYRSGVYRGSLSVDSALQNMTQVINNAALNGRFVGPAFKSYVFKRQKPPMIRGVVDDHIDFTEAVPSGDRTMMKKALAFSDYANNKILHPMHVTENINRGLAWWSGMEEAAALGMDAKDALKISMGKLSGISSPLTLTEQQYYSLLNVMKTQFGYDIAQQPPFAGNPLYRISSLFLSYPMRQLEFMSNEIGNAVRGYFAAMKTMGPVAAIDTVDKSKLMRFLALTGFMFGAPYAMGQVGLDVRNIWGKGAWPFSFPFYKSLIDGYNAIMGEEPMSREAAKDAFFESLGTAVIPQYRYLKKASSVIQNIERGFHTNKKGQYMWDTTPMGELLRLMGVGPEEYAQKRELAEAWYSVGKEYTYERRTALEELVLQKNPKPAQEFMKKWGRPITPKEVQEFMETLKKTQLERAVQNIPLDVISNVIQRQPYMMPPRTGM